MIDRNGARNLPTGEAPGKTLAIHAVSALRQRILDWTRADQCIVEGKVQLSRSGLGMNVSAPRAVDLLLSHYRKTGALGGEALSP